MKIKQRNLIDKYMREGETGWKPNKMEHKDKKKYNRKMFKKKIKDDKFNNQE